MFLAGTLAFLKKISQAEAPLMVNFFRGEISMPGFSLTGTRKRDRDLDRFWAASSVLRWSSTEEVSSERR